MEKVLKTLEETIKNMELIKVLISDGKTEEAGIILNHIFASFEALKLVLNVRDASLYETILKIKGMEIKELGEVLNKLQGKQYDWKGDEEPLIVVDTDTLAESVEVSRVFLEEGFIKFVGIHLDTCEPETYDISDAFVGHISFLTEIIQGNTN